MGLFDKMTQPVILKEDSGLDKQLEQLQSFLQEPISDEMREQVEQDIRYIKAGIFGENNLLFELKNSHIPMFVLRDLYISDGDLSAQIDFLVVTRKMRFIIECKNLYGNIEIDSTGSFMRTMQYGKRFSKVGIYSPITQNQRHLQLLRHIRSAQKGFLARKLYLSAFDDHHRAIVVLANPQTVLNASKAPKQVRDKVIRADQLIGYIKNELVASKNASLSDTELKDMAEMFLGLHKGQNIDYTQKYREKMQPETMPVNDAPNEIEVALSAANEIPMCPKCGVPMVRRKAAKGKDIGKEFYGCSNYPKCRKTVGIS